MRATFLVALLALWAMPAAAEEASEGRNLNAQPFVFGDRSNGLPCESWCQRDHCNFGTRNAPPAPGCQGCPMCDTEIKQCASWCNRWTVGAPPPPCFPSDASCRLFCTPRFVELLLPVRDALTLLPVPRFALSQCKSTFFFKESCGGCEVCIMG